MPTTKLNFTKSALDRLPIPAKRTYYRDTKEPRLGLYVTPTGVKSYFAIIRADGETIRSPIGRFPDVSVPLARIRAGNTISEVAEKGQTPAQMRRERKAASVTLSEVLETYLAERELKPSTKRDYRLAINESYKEFLLRPMAAISEKDVLKAYRERGKSSKARADNSARVLSALFNFARARYKSDSGRRLIPSNPTAVLNETRIRYRISARERVIPAGGLAKWWNGVQALDNHEARDFLVFLLLTGARRGETTRLEWNDIDRQAGTFHLADTKNRQPVTLPLPQYVARMWKGQLSEGYVFSPNFDPRKSITSVKKSSGIEFSPHDLRRTYITIAESLDISAYTVKALVNHKMKGDVTAGYVVQTPERLAEASARIETKILTLAGVLSGTVVPLRKSR